MPRRLKSWAEKMIAPEPHIDVTEKPFAGLPVGTRLLISSPGAVAHYLKTHVAAGTTMTVPELRSALARQAGADATCPLTASIFLRIAAEAAWDEMEGGADAARVTPFWRAVDPKSELARKLRCGPEWIARQRAAESLLAVSAGASA